MSSPDSASSRHPGGTGEPATEGPVQSHGHAADAGPESVPGRPLRVALIGNPNTGKSTLFNALAGMRVRTGNYPGVTVEQKVGRTLWQGKAIELIDLPGTYSLAPRSPDEMVTVNVLTGCSGEVPPDVVICICNALALERNLFLATQVQEIGLPTILCLNMWDEVERAGVLIDPIALSQELGLPVVTTSAHHRRGLDTLQSAVLNEVSRDSDMNRVREREARSQALLPSAVWTEVETLSGWLAEHSAAEDVMAPFLVLRSLLDPEGSVEQLLTGRTSSEYQAQLQASRTRLNQQGLRVAAVEAESRYAAASKIVSKVVRQSGKPHSTVTDRLDSVLTHRVFGFLICISVMLLIFSTINWFSQPLSGAIEDSIEAVADVVSGSMSPGPLRGLLTDGVIAGVGSVLVFLPQIALLFLFIALLEDCGYMARAAFMMDRLMATVGLSGRSFLPLMSSFACAVPGIMATRVIEDRRDRFVTILIAPLMSCSARLPVYVLMTGTFVPDRMIAGFIPLQALVLLLMTFLGLIVSIPVAFILRKTFFRGEPSTFLMELPDYRVPSMSVVLQRVLSSSWSFVRQAGTLIFATSVLIWAAGSIPSNSDDIYQLTVELEELEAAEVPDETRITEISDRLNVRNAEQLEQSILGRAGHWVEPVVRPLGWDWRIGVGVVASFPAREVVVATFGTIFSLGTSVDENDEGLRGALKAAQHPDGSPVFTVPVAISIMVFFAFCAQCVSTLVVIRRETNSWIWPVFSFVYMTGLAWLGAFVTYQVGSLL